MIELIRRHYLNEPSPPEVALNLNNPNPGYNPSGGNSQAILTFLGNKVQNYLNISFCPFLSDNLYILIGTDERVFCRERGV